MKLFGGTQATPDNRCRLCHGSAGVLLTPDNVHALCNALAARGLPTPSLGEFCSACNGTGRTGASPGSMLLLDGWTDQEISRSIQRQYPQCGFCEGKGYLSVKS